MEENGEPSWKRYTRLFPAISFSPKERLRFDVEGFRVVENSDRRLRSFFDDSPPCALRTIYNRWEFDRPNKTSGRNFGKRNSHCEKFPGKRGMFQRSVILMKYLSEGKDRFAGCFVKIFLSLTVLLHIYLRGGSS